MAKRRREQGCLIERSPGCWAIIVSKRDPATGKRKRVWHSFQGSEKEAKAERIRLLAADIAGTSIEPTKTTVTQFLELWLEHIQSKVAPRTFERYAEICRKNIVPLLGGARLAKLEPIDIERAYAKALVSGRRDGKGGLSPQTVCHIHRVLKQALKQATRWKPAAYPRNPCDAVDPPAVEQPTLNTYDMQTMTRALELARPWRIFIPALLAGGLGIRRGEIAALRWGRVDLDAAQAAIVESVEQTKAGIRFKTPKSKRTRPIALPAFVVRELRVWRVRQAQELLRLGVRLDADTLVCAREDGLPLQPNSLGHAWDRFLLANPDLPRIRFHDLRHAHATHMLAGGVHPKVASERLGHSRVALTLDRYSHVMPGMQETATALVDAAYDAALNRSA